MSDDPGATHTLGPHFTCFTVCYHCEIVLYTKTQHCKCHSRFSPSDELLIHKGIRSTKFNNNTGRCCIIPPSCGLDKYVVLKQLILGHIVLI